MKKILLIFLITLMLYSCKETNEQKVVTENKQVTEQNSSAIEQKKTNADRTHLCKINGQDWSFTKASGIVSRNKKTGIRTAIITFKNKLKKGSESIQLYYDGDSFKLNKVSVNIKRLNKSNKLFGTFYLMGPNRRNKNPETYLKGTIDLSNSETSSGNAEFKVENAYDKTQLKNSEDILISVTDLKFSGVGYSDISKFVEKYKSK